MQYTFIYQALLEHHLYGDTEMDVSSLERHLQALHSPTPHFHKLGLEEEFRVSLVFSVVVSVVLVPQSSATPSPVTPLAGLWPFVLQKLTNVRIMKENMRTGNLPANMKKARVIQIIPCKQARAGGHPRVRARHRNKAPLGGGPEPENRGENRWRKHPLLWDSCCLN